MKLGKDLALMGLGMAAVITYQKYGAPMVKKASNEITKAVKQMDNKMNQMM